LGLRPALHLSEYFSGQKRTRAGADNTEVKYYQQHQVDFKLDSAVVNIDKFSQNGSLTAQGEILTLRDKVFISHGLVSLCTANPVMIKPHCLVYRTIERTLEAISALRGAR